MAQPSGILPLVPDHIRITPDGTVRSAPLVSFIPSEAMIPSVVMSSEAAWDVATSPMMSQATVKITIEFLFILFPPGTLLVILI
jgi:hypothetical protein